MTKRTALVLLLCAALLLAVLACGTVGQACYSQYPGCEATAHAIETTIATVP